MHNLTAMSVACLKAVTTNHIYFRNKDYSMNFGKKFGKKIQRSM